MDKVMERITILEGKKLNKEEFCSLAELYAENGMLEKALNFINREASNVCSIYQDVALNLLGEWYYNGKYLPQDFKKAKEYFEKSAFMSMKARYNLGLYYFEGKDGAPDYLGAAVNFSFAAQGNNLLAALMAAEAYFRAGEGHIESAIEYAERAKAMGSETAVKLLEKYLVAKNVRDNRTTSSQFSFGIGYGESDRGRDDGMLDLLTSAMGFDLDVGDV